MIAALTGTSPGDAKVAHHFTVEPPLVQRALRRALKENVDLLSAVGPAALARESGLSDEQITAALKFAGMDGGEA